MDFKVSFYIVSVDKDFRVMGATETDSLFVSAPDEEEVRKWIRSEMQSDLMEIDGMLVSTKPILAVNSRGELVDARSPSAVTFRTVGVKIIPLDKKPLVEPINLSVTRPRIPVSASMGYETIVPRYDVVTKKPALSGYSEWQGVCPSIKVEKVFVKSPDCRNVVDRRLNQVVGEECSYYDAYLVIEIDEQGIALPVFLETEKVNGREVCYGFTPESGTAYVWGIDSYEDWDEFLNYIYRYGSVTAQMIMIEALNDIGEKLFPSRRGSVERRLSMRGFSERHSSVRKKVARGSVLASMWHPNFELKVYEDGDIFYDLNDFGWHWSGVRKDEMFLLYLARLSSSGVRNEWLKLFEEKIKSNEKAYSIVLDVFNSEKQSSNALDELVYNLTGDNSCYKFGECFWDMWSDLHSVADSIVQHPLLSEWVSSKENPDLAEEIIEKAVLEWKLPYIDSMYALEEAVDEVYDDIVKLVKSIVNKYPTPEDMVEKFYDDSIVYMEDIESMLRAGQYSILDEVLTKNVEDIKEWLDEQYESSVSRKTSNLKGRPREAGRKGIKRASEGRVVLDISQNCFLVVDGNDVIWKSPNFRGRTSTSSGFLLYLFDVARECDTDAWIREYEKVIEGTEAERIVVDFYRRNTQDERALETLAYAVFDIFFINYVMDEYGLSALQAIMKVWNEVRNDFVKVIKERVKMYSTPKEFVENFYTALQEGDDYFELMEIVDRTASKMRTASKRRLSKVREKISVRKKAKWVPWYEYEDYDPRTGMKFKVKVQANRAKDPLEVVEDELIQLRKEVVKLKELLGKQNREITASRRRIAFNPANRDRWVKYWNSLTGPVEHKMTKCIEKVSDAGFTDDPEAFCAALKDFVLGTTKWRTGRKPKRSSAMRRKRETGIIGKKKASLDKEKVRKITRRIRRLAALKRKAEDEQKVEAPKQEAPQNVEQKAPQTETTLSGVIIEKLAELFGVNPKEIELKDIFFDKEKGVIQVNYSVNGKGEQVAFAVLQKNAMYIRTAGFTVNVDLGNQSVKYDIPTKTVNPFPKNHTEKIEKGVDEKDGELPKGVQEIAVEGYDVPKPSNKAPEIAVTAGKKQADDEIVKLATEITNLLIQKGVIPAAQKNDQIMEYVKKYAGKKKALQDLLETTKKVLASSATVIVDDEGKPVDLKELF